MASRGGGPGGGCTRQVLAPRGSYLEALARMQQPPPHSPIPAPGLVLWGPLALFSFPLLSGVQFHRA